MTSLTREHVTALNHYAVELYRAGDRNKAAETALLAYAAASELCAPDEFLRLLVTQNTAAVLESIDAADGAMKLYREIVQVETEENRQRRAYAHERLFEMHSARSEWRDAVAEGDASFEAWEARGEPADETLLTFVEKLAFAHYSASDLDGAARFCELLVGERKELSGENSASFATALRSLGRVRQTQGRVVAAETLFRRALEIRRTLVPEDESMTFEVLRLLADCCSTQGKHSEAAVCYEEVVRRTRPDGGSIDFARDLNNLATCYFDAGDIAASRPLYEEALQIARAIYGPSHPTVADAEGNLANVLRRLGELGASEEALLRVRDGRHAIGDDNRTASTLGDLLETYQEQQSLAGMESLYHDTFDRVLESYETSGTLRAPLIDSLRGIGRAYAAATGTASSLLRRNTKRRRQSWFRLPRKRLRRLLYLGEVAVTIGDDDQLAQELFAETRRRSAGVDEAVWYRASAGLCMALARLQRPAEAVAVCDEAVGRGEITTAHAEAAAAMMRTKASALIDLGDRDAASSAMRESMGWTSRVRGQDSVQYADAAGRLAEIEWDRRDAVEAKKLAERAIEIAERHGAALVVARARKVLASVARGQGDLTTSEHLYSGAQTTFDNAWGQGRAQRAVLRDLAFTYANALQPGRALTLFESALAAAERDNADPAEVLDLKLAIGEVQLIAAQVTKAVELFKEVAEAAQRGDDRLREGRAFLNAGNAYVMIGADREAHDVLLKARSLLEEAGARPYLASAMYNLAKLESRFGSHDQALATLDETISLLQATGQSIEAALQERGWILARCGRWDEAAATIAGSCDLTEERTLQSLVLAGEAQRESVVTPLYSTLDFLLTLAVRLQTPAAVSAALERLLRWKGMALEWTALQAAGLAGPASVETALMREELAAIRAQLSELALAGTEAADAAAMRNRAGSLDFELSKRSAAAVTEMRPTVTLAAVTGMLPENTLLVEYARYESIDFAQGARGSRFHPGRYRYAGFALRRGHEPLLFDAGDAAEIESRINSLRNQITREGGKAPAADAGEELRRSLLDVVLAGMPEDSIVCIAPDGDLSRLPFAALPLGDGYLLDRFELSFVNSGRELLYERGAVATQPSAPIVVADPDFDLGIETVKGVPLRPFARLAGTYAEGTTVAACLGVEALTGRLAVESAIHAARGPRVLHLATHAFFLNDDRPPIPDDVVEEIGVISIPGGGTYVATVKDRVREVDEGPRVDRFRRIGRLANPLLRAGIVFAGANTWASGGTLPREVGDAILTAEEVCSLDLHGTDLIVLSACETGLGEVRSGEGVYGLRRAFAIAGARVLVVSLWKVPDAETAELMVRFYSCLSGGEPYSRALRSAQLRLRRSGAAPVCWAGFVCIGDPLPRV